MTSIKIRNYNLINDRWELPLLLILVSNLIIKIIPASFLELGNDEVYYWTYALFPDLSHFDHPPMVGFLIQLFTLNNSLHGELFMRAGPLILSSLNIIILFYLVKRVYSRSSAYFAVIMYISSFYFNIISGLFILPDAPQVFFVLLALYHALPSVTTKTPARRDNINILLFGFFTGLAFLSKYHSLFLWFGMGLYILFHNRTWLKKPALYISVILTLILMMPVIYWNYNNDFISFTFQGNRIGLFQNQFNFTSFMQFNLGQFFYQNPVLFVIYSITLLSILRNKQEQLNPINLYLLYSGIPLILIFTFFSLFRSALPHWSGPAFICLIILSSKYLADIYIISRVKVKRILSMGLGLFVILLVFGTLQIKFGLINNNNDSMSEFRGENDFTLDMYGWQQAGESFHQFLDKEGISKEDHNHIAIISNNWFPAAHIDYYIAYPLNIKLYALGSIERIHKYYWINKARKDDEIDKVYYITDSRNYHSPKEYENLFSEIIPKDTLNIFRNHQVAKMVYVYEMIPSKNITILSSQFPWF